MLLHLLLFISAEFICPCVNTPNFMFPVNFLFQTKQTDLKPNKLQDSMSLQSQIYSFTKSTFLVLSN